MENLVNQHIKALKSRVADPTRSGHAIYLDRNELPYPPSPAVIQAISDAVPLLNRYPDTLGGSLRKTLANYASVAEEEIIIGNGSDDLIELIVKVFMAPQEEVLIPNPTFPVYALSTQVMGGKPIFMKRGVNFDLNIKEIINQVTEATKIIFVANPNNPTGNLVDRQDLKMLIENVNCLVVVDECYYEMSQQTVSDWINDYKNLLVLRSFSKSFGLASLRLGYGIANAQTIDYLYRATQIFPVNTLALLTGMAALTDVEYAKEKIKQVCQERENLREKIEQMGFGVYPSATNFIFVNTKPLGILSADLVQRLREQNIWVRDFGGKLGLEPYYFRTAIGTMDQNQKLQDALGKVMAHG